MNKGKITVLGKAFLSNPDYSAALEEACDEFNNYLMGHALVIDWETEVESDLNKLYQELYHDFREEKGRLPNPEENQHLMEHAGAIRKASLFKFSNWIDVNYTGSQANNGNGIHVEEKTSTGDSLYFGKMDVKPGISNYKTIRGLVMHELGHALGMSDKNKHVLKIYDFNPIFQIKRYDIQKRSLPIMSTGISNSKFLTANDLAELYSLPWYEPRGDFYFKELPGPELYEDIKEIKLKKHGTKRSRVRARKSIRLNPVKLHKIEGQHLYGYWTNV